MVRHELGLVVRPSEALDPVGCANVLLPAREARDLSVGDVAHEHVPERVLRLAPDSRPALAPQDPLAIERVQRVVVRVDRTRPEDLPVDRRVLDDPLLLRRETVEPRGDQPLHRLG